MKLFVTLAAFVVAFTVGAAEHSNTQKFHVNSTELPFTKTICVRQFDPNKGTLIRVEIQSKWEVESEGSYDAEARLDGTGTGCPECTDNHWIGSGLELWSLGLGIDEGELGLAQYIGDGKLELDVVFTLESSTIAVFGSVELTVTYFWEN